ncbi:MAG: type II toxin-antitoxin system VapC family toxin [Solirubrobacterales bacterium]
MIVLDASAAVDFLIAFSPAAGPLDVRVGSVPEVHVPELFELEVLSALRGLERGARVEPSRLAAALWRFDGLRAVTWPHAELRSRIWAQRHRLSIYDASYAALAHQLDLPLVTTDARLAAGVEAGTAVELYE